MSFITVETNQARRYVVQRLALVPHRKKVVGLIPCVELACSPRVCVGFHSQKTVRSGELITQNGCLSVC